MLSITQCGEGYALVRKLEATQKVLCNYFVGVYTSRLCKYYSRNIMDRNVSKYNLFAVLLFSCPLGLREEERNIKILKHGRKTVSCDGGSRRIVNESAMVDQLLSINRGT
jgi:hypothetical protein